MAADCDPDYTLGSRNPEYSLAMSKQRLNPRASTWMLIDNSETPLHSGVLGIFQPPASADRDYIIALADDLRGCKNVVAPWNWVLGPPLAPGLPPRVSAVPVELDYHFRHSALPSPGGERELGQLVSRLHSNRLDYTRPLWEYHLIEGLEHNRFAVYLKIHRALIEDINAVPLFIAHLPGSARSRKPCAVWGEPINEPTRRSEQRPMENLVSIAGAAARAGMGLLRSALDRNAISSVLLPNSAPRSTLNRPISHSRRFATWQFDVARIEGLAAATDSTINEILSYLCGSSLRRFFKEYNALPDESLVGLVPVSTRERSDDNPGGAVAALRVELGTHIGNPLARLESVKQSLKSVRRDRASLPEEAGTAYALMRASPVIISQLKGVGRLIPPLFNLRVSMTEGPDRPRYMQGARLLAVYPVNPLFQFNALSIDCVQYAGTFNFGFTGARETLPSLQRLAVYLGKAADDLEAIVAAQQEAS